MRPICTLYTEIPHFASAFCYSTKPLGSFDFAKGFLFEINITAAIEFP